MDTRLSFTLCILALVLKGGTNLQVLEVLGLRGHDADGGDLGTSEAGRVDKEGDGGDGRRCARRTKKGVLLNSDSQGLMTTELEEGVEATELKERTALTQYFLIQIKIYHSDCIEKKMI